MSFDCKKAKERGLCKSSDCCGVMQLNKKLIANNLDKIQIDILDDIEEKLDLGDKILFITKDFRCIFLDRETQLCSIYEQRPDVCKYFGTGEYKDGSKDVLLFCPYLKPNGNEWSPAKRKRLQRQVDKIFKEKELKYKKLKKDEKERIKGIYQGKKF